MAKVEIFTYGDGRYVKDMMKAVKAYEKSRARVARQRQKRERVPKKLRREGSIRRSGGDHGDS